MGNPQEIGRIGIMNEKFKVGTYFKCKQSENHYIYGQIVGINERRQLVYYRLIKKHPSNSIWLKGARRNCKTIYDCKGKICKFAFSSLYGEQFQSFKDELDIFLELL